MAGNLGPIGMTNGLTPFGMTIASGTSATVIQLTTQPTQLCAVSAGSIAAVARWLKFFDSANAIEPGAAALFQMIIPGNVAGAGSNLHVSQGPPIISGLQFNSGLAFAVTANNAISDASGISGPDVTVLLGYR